MLESLGGDFEVWELIGEHEHYVPSLREKIQDLMPSYDIILQLHLPFSDINLASVIPEAREMALRFTIDSLVAGADVGIRSMTLHPGTLSSVTWRDRGWALEIAKRSIRDIDRAAKERDVRINLENMPFGKFMLGNTLEELLYLIEGLDEDTWGLCYDTGHGLISGQEDVFLDSAELITNLHVHDNHGSEDSHMIPGMGCVNFDRIVQAYPLMRSESIIFETNSLHEGKEGLPRLMKMFE